MTIPASTAAGAYASAARALAQATKTTTQDAAGATGDSSFGDLVKQSVESATTSMKKADGVSLAHVTGGADVVDVVTAVAETEVTLRTLVNVRDRVIAAYQEIMRMPI